MDRELWTLLSQGMFDVARSFPKPPRQTFSAHDIVRVYLWAVLHDRPVLWATNPRSWPSSMRPRFLPNQSTMSRRLRVESTQQFLSKLGRRITGRPREVWVKMLDGKPLPIAKHSKDPDAAFGRGAGGMDKGYKLHAIWGGAAMPLAWAVQPLNVSETQEARCLIPQLRGEGYLLADANYDSEHLYTRANSASHQLIAPRKRSGTRLGHRRHSPQRLRSIHLLEQSPSPFGRALFAQRRDIERQFGGLVSFSGGLQSLPPWVRTLGRVRLFVHAKLIINAARIRRLDA